MSRDPQLTDLTGVRRHPQPLGLYEELRKGEQIEIDLHPFMEAIYSKSVSFENQPQGKVTRMFAAGIVMGLIGFGLAIGSERVISKYLIALPTATVLLPQTPDNLILTQNGLGAVVGEKDGEPPQVRQVSGSSHSSLAAAVTELLPVYDEDIELSVPPDDTSDHSSIAPGDALETALAADPVRFRTITVDGQTYEISIPPRTSAPDYISANEDFDEPEMDLHMLRMPRQLVIANPAAKRTYYGLTPQDILRQHAAQNR